MLCCLLPGVSERQAGRHEPLLVPSETVACCCISKAGQTGCDKTKMPRDRCLPPMVIANLGAVTTTRRPVLFSSVHRQSATLYLEEEEEEEEKARRLHASVRLT